MSARSSFFHPLEGLLAEFVPARERLDRAADVTDVEEDQFAVATLAGDPSHHPVAELRVLTLPQRLRVVRGLDVGGVVARQEAVRVGIDPFLAQLRNLRATFGLARSRGVRGAIAGGDALLVGRVAFRHGARPVLTRSLPS